MAPEEQRYRAPPTTHKALPLSSIWSWKWRGLIDHVSAQLPFAQSTGPQEVDYIPCCSFAAVRVILGRAVLHSVGLLYSVWDVQHSWTVTSSSVIVGSKHVFPTVPWRRWYPLAENTTKEEHKKWALGFGNG